MKSATALLLDNMMTSKAQIGPKIINTTLLYSSNIKLLYVLAD